MHKLDRALVTEPACLAQYDHKRQTWDDLRDDHKREIREALEVMQQMRCAYCEGAYYSHDRHIEHFRRKNSGQFPELTFIWTNLFLSCDADNQEHCGHYKDRKGSPYNPEDLIKPDDDEPDDYLYFHSSGEVRPWSGIDEARERRAKETIRVFNLNYPSLNDENISKWRLRTKEIPLLSQPFDTF
jgi:uncharacterized protein (TIGR02646 family)